MTDTPLLSTTLSLDDGLYRVQATSFNATVPSGLGAFATEDEAIKAMDALQAKIIDQAGRKQVSKKKAREAGE